MKLEKLQPPARPPEDIEPRQAKVPVAAGHVTITYTPVREGAEALPLAGLLGQHLVGWDIEDSNGEPVRLSTDVINSLAPDVREAIAATVLAGKSEPGEKAEKG